MYTREWTARFADVDMFQIVFYPELVREVHDTTDMFLEEIGFPLWQLQNDYGIGLPIVETGTQFHRPIEAGETVTIELTHEMGESSLRVDFAATHDDGADAFDAYEQRVCVPLGGDHSVPLPDDLRRALRDAADP